MTCDGCRACCTIIGITALQKPPQTPCAHECQNGCGIYQQRPKECVDYKCAYLEGALGSDPQWRPDNLGVLVDFGEMVCFFQETRPNAFQEKKVISTIEYVRKRFAHIIERCFFVPHAVGDEFGERVREHRDQPPLDGDWIIRRKKTERQ